MGPLGSSLASQFWNEEVESTRSLEACVRSLPREPPPLAMVRGSKISRSQQLLLLQRLLRLPFAPSLAPDCDCPSGIVLDRVVASTGGTNWWATLTGRLRVQRLFAKRSGAKLELNGFSEAAAEKQQQRDGKWTYAKRLLDKSLYALCMRTKLLLGPSTSLSIKAEMDSLEDWGSSEVPMRVHSKLLHKLKKHDLSLEAAWHERFMDREARYWDVPQAVSLDIASVGLSSGLYYRLGVHHSSGQSQNCCGGAGKEIPWGAMPGTCAQAAVSYGKEIDIWKEDDAHFGRKLHKPYNLLAARPHITLSGVVGGVVNASLGQRKQPLNAANPSLVKSNGDRSVSADAFGSLGVTAQFGLFQRFLLDHTKFAARVDIGGASSTVCARTLSAKSSSPSLADGQNGITFALTMQQQVLGPLRARADSRFSPDLSTWNARPALQEVTYGLDCSLESLGAAKLVVWYCPTRSEGMAEIRLLEI
ncbi:hypothetical protein SELMODRAFT_117300 [Selaginella moellendorffii]|uniref:Uncharacterized protein n=1 Tax=Selaginella moellendorffii TaxID=88036 RepID=D8SHJ1_SELML|nr:protein TRIGALACTOSYLDIACYLGLYCEROL 4, chloroplastic [Selaginella moellendorffii]EFJ16013.1 hypothetical protein SELMODRAFT_117300 [Selaginella moellendorffii]|eukprot:XP_002982768.1 protein TRIGALACTOSYLDIACYLGLYCEROL 4, chloroplastic [Selaginella moellendorffii]